MADDKKKAQDKLNKRLEERRKRKKEQKINELEEKTKGELDREEAEQMRKIAAKDAKQMETTEKLLAAQTQST